MGKALVSAALCLVPACVWSADRPLYHPYVDQDHPRVVYWGDTHLHTHLSVDAFVTALTPDDAYRFARGEVVQGTDGVPMKMRRPLDFLVVADHAENMGLLAKLELEDPALVATEAGARWWQKLQKALPAIRKYRQMGEFDAAAIGSILTPMNVGAERVGGVTFSQSVWNEVAQRADRYNQPGKFTAFSGYEWSPLETFIHRVVIFKDDAATVTQALPFSQLDSVRPEDLWKHLEKYSKLTGGEVLAIPHNANLTRGHMFMLEDSGGNPFTRDYAGTRSRWEPLLEVTQKKGDSETHPMLSPTDAFADYERHERFSKVPDRGLQYSYARSALKLGLDQHSRLGINPFKFGLIGSSDSHTGLSVTDAENFWAMMPHPPHQLTARNPFSVPTVEHEAYLLAKYNIAGYAAVWARDNTREALFQAMKRREVYATTGARIELRFFGGWSYQAVDALRPELASVGYAKGVPMGGDLTQAPAGRAPRFLIRAVKDPVGANLDRIQVIKGWRDKHGRLFEKIYNVALSDGRRERHDGTVPPVGTTVDVPNASYTNSIGDPELSVVWEDPGFNRNELAFYYARVIEIPTPRWTAYYAKFLQVPTMPAEIPMVMQQRAYSSPIWYSP